MPIGLYHLHLATTEQLTRLHYKPGMLKTVSKRLKVLVDNGYIQADCIPTKLFKSPYYYTLDTKGMRYLVSIGLDTIFASGPVRKSSKAILHLRHALEFNDVFDRRITYEIYPSAYYLVAVYARTHLERTPFKVRLDGHHTLIPDGFLDFRQPTTGRSLFLIIEHDRGTEQQDHFRRRIRAYKAFLELRRIQATIRYRRLTVAFTTFISSQARRPDARVDES